MKPAILIVVVLAAFARIAQSVGGSESPDRMAYRDAATIANGKSVYADYCASCHGADLSGQPDWQTRDADGYLPAPPHNESGHTWHHPDDQLFEIVKHGTEALVGGGYRSNMAGFGDVLSDDEIRAALAYIKSNWPEQIIERHDDMNAAFDKAR